MHQVISSPNAPTAVGPYSQGILAGNTLYLSGQIPLDPATGKLVEGDVVKQAEQVMSNIRALLDAAGFQIEDVVKSTCFLTDLANFQAFNGVYSQTYSTHKPARSTFQVAGLPLGALVEVETIAVRS